MKPLLKWLRANWFAGRTAIANASLKKWNVALAVVFLVQACVILLFGTSYGVPLNILFLNVDTLQTQLTHHTVWSLAIHQLGTVNVTYIIAAIFFIAAIVHLGMATTCRTYYDAAVKKGANVARWIEYSVSAGLIVVLLGLLVGVYDLGSLCLIGLFGMMAGFLGVYREQRLTSSARTYGHDWLLRILTIIAGVAPFLMITLYVLAAHIFGSGHMPAYLFGVIASTLILFIAFSLNARLVRMKKGKWASYAFGERLYMMLSFVLRTLLAWQIFAAILRP